MVQTLRRLVLWVLIFGVAFVSAENTEIGELRRLAEQGEVEAQNRLGDMYTYGPGVPRDTAEAVKWYRMAADQGDAKAQNSLGIIHKEDRR